MTCRDYSSQWHPQAEMCSSFSRSSHFCTNLVLDSQGPVTISSRTDTGPRLGVCVKETDFKKMPVEPLLHKHRKRSLLRGSQRLFCIGLMVRFTILILQLRYRAHIVRCSMNG